MTFDLFTEDDKTWLKLTHAGLGTFHKTNPDLTIVNFAAGWIYIPGTSLADFHKKLNQNLYKQKGISPYTETNAF